MKRPARAPGFSDDRGVIADLLVEPLDCVTRISTVTGAVRGNHYHRETIQFVYCLFGRLRIVTQDVDASVDPVALLPGTWTEDVLRPHEIMISPPGEAHAWEAIESTAVLVFTRGPRSGPDYESDTFRLPDDQKLIP